MANISLEVVSIGDLKRLTAGELKQIETDIRKRDAELKLAPTGEQTTARINLKALLLELGQLEGNRIYAFAYDPGKPMAEQAIQLERSARKINEMVEDGTLKPEDLSNVMAATYSPENADTLAEDLYYKQKEVSELQKQAQAFYDAGLIAQDPKTVSSPSDLSNLIATGKKAENEKLANEKKNEEKADRKPAPALESAGEKKDKDFADVVEGAGLLFAAVILEETISDIAKTAKGKTIDDAFAPKPSQRGKLLKEDDAPEPKPLKAKDLMANVSLDYKGHHHDLHNLHEFDVLKVAPLMNGGSDGPAPPNEGWEKKLPTYRTIFKHHPQVSGGGDGEAGDSSS